MDLLTEAMVKNLSQSNGFLIDGYPRELEQGVQFEEKVFILANLVMAYIGYETHMCAAI